MFIIYVRKKVHANHIVATQNSTSGYITRNKKSNKNNTVLYMLKSMKVTLECVYCVQFAEHVDQTNRVMINYNQR